MPTACLPFIASAACWVAAWLIHIVFDDRDDAALDAVAKQMFGDA